MNKENEKIINKFIKDKHEPKVYTFRTDKVPDSLKVGYTYRPVNERISEWRRKYKDNLSDRTSYSTQVGEKYFKDTEVHTYLQDVAKKHKLEEDEFEKTEYYCTEFFKDTEIKDVENAVKDIRKDIKTGGGHYRTFSIAKIKDEEEKDITVGPYKPRDIQKEAIEKYVEVTKHGTKKKNLLLYAVMRYGKTFTALCCAKETNARVVVVVSAKVDVKREWKKAVKQIANFKSEYTFVDAREELDDEIIRNIKSKKNKYVIFLSLQSSSNEYAIANYKKLFKAHIDLLIIDETHYGARASTYSKAIKEQNDDDTISAEAAKKEIDHFTDVTVKLHLSGTPYRILARDEFKEKDIIGFYPYTRILEEKEKWNKKYNDENEWKNPYYGFPEMLRFAFKPNEASIKKLKKEFNGETSFSNIFKTESLTKEKGDLHKKFKYEEQVYDLLKILDGSKEEKGLLGFLNYPKIKENNMCKHIVCVLPWKASCDALEKLIEKNKRKLPRLRQYEIINISGFDSKKGYKDTEDVVNAIKEFETQKKKTITLSVGRMLTGSTVPYWDTMLYFKDTTSPESYDQAIFRLQNPYVVDSVSNDGKEIEKIDKKPQTILIDFCLDRMFKLQAKRAEVFNEDKKLRGAKEWEKRIEEDLKLSPIINFNIDKIKQVTTQEIVDKIREYYSEKGIVENANELDIDESLLKNKRILSMINDLNPINSKKGLGNTRLVDSDDGDNIDLPRKEDDEKEESIFETEEEIYEDKKTINSIEKKLRAYIAKLLFYAFLTKDNVQSINDIIDSIEKNNRNLEIAKHLGIDVKDLKYFVDQINGYKMNDLDIRIQNLNDLSKKNEDNPIKRVEEAIKQFGKISDSEIVTPHEFACKAVDLIPKKKIKAIKKDENIKFLDIASKMGEFAFALVEQLKKIGYNEKEYKNKIYSITTSGITYELTRYVYEALGLNYKCIAKKFTSYDLLNVKAGDKIDYERIKNILTQNKDFEKITLLDDKIKKGENKVKFEAIVGNPPYQKTVREATTGNNKNTVSIYEEFQEISLKIADSTCLIYPAKEFQRGKKNTQDLRLKYLRIYNGSERNGEKHIPDGESVFGDMVRRIPGDVGLTYYNYDKASKTIKYQDEEVERSEKILPIRKEFLSIAKKLEKYVDTFKLSKIKKVCESNFVENHPESVLKEECGPDKPSKPNYSKVLTNHKAGSRGKAKWYYIKTKDLDRKPNIDKYKLVLASARLNEALADSDNLEILKKDESFGRTKKAIYDSEDLEKVEHCKKYLSTKFAKCINAMTPEKFLYYLPDFDSIYNDIDKKVWNSTIENIDKELFKKFGFSKEEIKLIENEF